MQHHHTDRSSTGSGAYGYYYQSTPSSRSTSSSFYESRPDSFHRPLSFRGPAFPASFHSLEPSTGQATPSSPPAGHSAALLPSAIPRPASLSSTPKQNSTTPTVRAASIDSPRSIHFAAGSTWVRRTPDVSPLFEPRDLDRFPHGHTPTSIHKATATQDEHLPQTTFNRHHRGRPSQSNTSSLIPRPRHDRSISYHTAQNSVSDYDGQPLGLGISSGSESRSSVMSSQSKTTVAPPNLTLQVGSTQTTVLQDNNNNTTTSPQEPGKRPKSPAISSFFGWRRGSNVQNDSPTTISESRSISPSAPPSKMPQNGAKGASSPVLGEEDDYYGNGSYYGSNSPVRSGSAILPHVDELMRELRDVSAELAISIRREMELEDELDRVKTDMPTGPMEHNRRTSDYYSDSGASSIRLIAAGSETKIEGLEKMRRKAEQEKAQIRLEMSEKAQEDLNQRRALEMHVQSLEEQLTKHSAAGGERSAEHQKELDDTKRRLNEERGFKENFEDLLGGMREEIEAYRNERDNLRDEVVPQLRSRLEGLESQATEMPTLAYENTRLQQENQSLRNEIQTLVNARRLQLDMQQSSPRFKSIAEEEDENSQGLGRSNSLVRSRSTRNRSNSLSKTKDGQMTGEPHADGFKALEDQRDALHRTLKILILRQESMTRDHAKRVRALETERDNAISGTQRRTAFRFEVQNLRSDINHLRRRADDALERKWQCEKGLSGLKMDLDRAQQETSSLRELLQANDIFYPDRSSNSSESLNVAYSNLLKVYAASIEKLESQARDSNDDEASHLIRTSESRMRDLSAQIETQITFNDELRSRLEDAMDRGVAEQKSSAQKIMDLETLLQTTEEQLIAATNVSEEVVSNHEEYIKTMRDATDEHSRRGIVSRTPTAAKRASVVSLKRSSVASLTPKDITNTNSKIPLFSGRSPRLAKIRSGNATGVAEKSEIDTLQKRTRELEEAATSADKEMQKAVEKMNRAQIEVADLQTLKDEAMKKTSRLQRHIIEERERARALAV